MPTPPDNIVLRMDGWPGGVNNRMRETEQSAMRDGEAVPSSQFLRKALNVDLTAEGHPLRRRGQQAAAGLTSRRVHSLWASNRLDVMFAVDADAGLLIATRDEGVTGPSIAINKYLAVSYCEGETSIFWSNGADMGEFDPFTSTFRPWGVPVPPQPTVTGPAAENPNGWSDTRQIAVTYEDTWGREGGASEPVVVGGDGTMTVDIPMPLPTNIAKAHIYVSQIGSEILYLTQSTVATSPITIYPQDVGRGKELNTLNLHPPKPGQLVEHFNGRVYIARNDSVRFTEPLRPHLTRPSQGLYMFPENVSLLQPSRDGIYVGHNRGVSFIAGSDPYDVRQMHVTPYAPIPGAVSRVPGEKFGLELDDVPVWWGIDGVMVLGLPGGQLRQLTRDRLAVPQHTAGAVAMREREGMSHIVSSLRKGDDVNNMGATDTVVAEVRRNDIILNT